MKVAILLNSCKLKAVCVDVSVFHLALGGSGLFEDICSPLQRPHISLPTTGGLFLTWGGNCEIQRKDSGTVEMKQNKLFPFWSIKKPPEIHQQPNQDKGESAVKIRIVCAKKQLG